MIHKELSDDSCTDSSDWFLIGGKCHRLQSSLFVVDLTKMGSKTIDLILRWTYNTVEYWSNAAGAIS